VEQPGDQIFGAGGDLLERLEVEMVLCLTDGFDQFLETSELKKI
jgi:hypothetical protein